jgi:DNA-binding beta-propeller fold protein YncE
MWTAKGLNALGACLLAGLCTACGGGGGSEGAGTATLSSRAATLSLVAGSATESGYLDAGGAAARFNTPVGITIDAAGNLYVAERSNCAIRKITPAGAVSTLAGSPQRCDFPYLTALAAAPDGRLYATDGLDVREISPAGAVRTIATLETATVIGSQDIPYFYGGGIAVDPAGNLVVTNAIGTRRIALSGSSAGAVTMLEGVAKLDSMINVWTSHAFAQRGVAAAANGTVYVSDAANTVSRIDASGKKTAIAGLSGAGGVQDGSGSVARFDRVVALTLDGTGNLYAADAGNQLIRRIAPDQMVTTVAGNPPLGLPALAGVVTDGKGNLYAISGNAVVKIALP